MAIDKPEEILSKAKKKLEIEFDDYNNAVTLIASIEALFRHEFPGGNGCARLTSFDRFPEWFGKTPEFLITFDNAYLLCGEHKKTFRDDNAAQVAGYSQCALGKHDHYDVMVLTGTTSHKAASRAMKKHFDDLPPAKRAHRPIVILGIHIDHDHGNEFYAASWIEGVWNEKFSVNNVAAEGHSKNLNKTIVEKDYFTIRIDRNGLARAGRAPIINDDPPLLYTAVRLLLPVLQESVTPEEREAALIRREHVYKEINPDTLKVCDDVLSNSKALQHIRRALKRLSLARFCKEEISGKKTSYLVPMHRVLHAKDHKDLFADVFAHYDTRKHKYKKGGKDGTLQPVFDY